MAQIEFEEAVTIDTIQLSPPQADAIISLKLSAGRVYETKSQLERAFLESH